MEGAKEMRLRIGDKVEVIKGGLGISDSRKGEVTTVTEIGGIYGSGGDMYGPMSGVKANNIYNPGFSDWVTEDSFKLISRNIWKGKKR